MSTVIVVLSHADLGDSIQTNIHGVYINEALFHKEANELQYEYDVLNKVYFTTIGDIPFEFEIVLQHVIGSS